MSPETQPRYLQGLAKLREIDGHAGERGLVVADGADRAQLVSLQLLHDLGLLRRRRTKGSHQRVGVVCLVSQRATVL